MKKIIIIALIAVVIILGLILMVLRSSRQPGPSDQPGQNNTVTPTTFRTSNISPASDRPTVSAELQEQAEDHHDTFLPTTAPLQDAQLVFMGDNTTTPQGWKFTPQETYTADSSGRKFSPNKDFYAINENNQLIIRSVTDNQTVRTVPISEGTQQINFVWSTQDTLLLTEKESARKKIDRIYTVDRISGTKSFILGSFAVVKRFNLDAQVRTFNDGTDVVFTDNDGKLWDLNLTYK